MAGMLPGFYDRREHRPASGGLASLRVLLQRGNPRDTWGMAGGAEQEGPCVLEGVMKDLRTQEPTHLLSPDQRLPWRQEGPGTPGMERASEGPGSRTPGQGRQARSHGGLRLRWVRWAGAGVQLARAPSGCGAGPTARPGPCAPPWRPATRGPSSHRAWRGAEERPGGCRHGPRAPTGPLRLTAWAPSAGPPARLRPPCCWSHSVALSRPRPSWPAPGCRSPADTSPASSRLCLRSAWTPGRCGPGCPPRTPPGGSQPSTGPPWWTGRAESPGAPREGQVGSGPRPRLCPEWSPVAPPSGTGFQVCRWPAAPSPPMRGAPAGRPGSPGEHWAWTLTSSSRGWWRFSHSRIFPPGWASASAGSLHPPAALEASREDGGPLFEPVPRFSLPGADVWVRAGQRKTSVCIWDVP